MHPEGTSTSDSQPTGGPSPLVPGQLVGGGRYELQRMLAKGGMGSVWLALDSRLQERVALKFLPSEILHDSAAFREMQREAAKSRKFSHPNIIRIHDLHESPDEAPFISMEFVEGDNLHNLSGQQPHHFFTWEQIKPWVKQLCDALTYAHDEGLIHRDIKPANLMVDMKGRLKLADFGISMKAGESRKGGPATPINGTLGYMSPQQLSGHPAHVTDDIHALGATLYELLTGRRPFDSGDVYSQVLNQKAKPLNEALWEQGLTNDIPSAVSALIMACLAKDPSMRPASAKAFADWLDLNGEERPAEAPPTTAADNGHPPEHAAAVSQGRKLRWLERLVIYVVFISAVTVGLLWARNKLENISQGETPDPLPQNADRVPKYGPQSLADLPAPSAMMLSNSPVSTAAKRGPGSIDERFTPTAAPNKIVFASLRQPDGKYVVGGDFTKVGTNDFSGIARYNPDGTLDAAFSRFGPINDAVHTLLLLPDGKLLIGGQFNSVHGVPVGHLARLNPDGSLDRTFALRIPDGSVNCLLAQPDGKILVSGGFTRLEPGNLSRGRIVRLNGDGTLDRTFTATSGFDDSIDRLAVQPDGKIVIAGKFTKVGQGRLNRVARLLPSGALDSSFNVGEGVDGNVLALELMKDGSILLGGSFIRSGMATVNYLVRLQSNGQLDRGFPKRQPPFVSTANAFVGAIMVVDDRIWVGGNFTVFAGRPCARLVRLNLDGSFDPDFNQGSGIDGSVRSFCYSPEDGMLIGGNFKKVEGTERPHLTRLKGGTKAQDTQ